MDFMDEIMKAYKAEHGEDAKFEEGETQVFELNDCTVILSLQDKDLGIKILGDKPIKVDCTTGFFKESEE